MSVYDIDVAAGNKIRKFFVYSILFSNDLAYFNKNNNNNLKNEQNTENV